MYVQYLSISGGKFRDQRGKRPKNSFVIKFIYILTASLIEKLFIPPINSAFVAFAAREPSPIEFPHVDPTPQHLV